MRPILIRFAGTCRLILLAVFALLFAAAAASGESAPPRRFERGLLWRIDVPGVAPSYLFGTLHADDERVLELAGPVRRAFARSRRFALEMVNDETAIRRYRAAMVTREAKLPAALGADDYTRIEALLGARGVPREARGRFKPWAALIVLAQPPASPGIILDNLLLMEAQRLGKPVEPLETVDEQIAALAEMAEETQLALLRHVAARQDEIALAVAPLTQAYLERDLAGMWRANQEAMGDAPAVAADNAVFIERLLFARNARFAERLAPLVRRGGLFAAFGALHLYGPRGVPALLAQQGFRLTRVR